MDIKINHPMEFSEIKERISKSFPSEMKVLEVYSPEEKFKNIVFAEYMLKLFSPRIAPETAADINQLFSEECIVTKKSKSGEKEVDIRDFIKKIEAKYVDGCIEMCAIVAAGNESNLNPELLVEAIRKHMGILNSGTIEEYCTIMRNKLLDAELNEFK